MLMNMSINYYLTATHQLADAATMRQVGQSIVLGIQTLEMGVLGGIVVGVITYFLHERFQDTVLHDAFAFFSGIRFVPIITALTLSLVGLFIPLLWEYVAMGIAGIGHIIQSTSVFSHSCMAWAYCCSNLLACTTSCWRWCASPRRAALRWLTARKWPVR